MRRLVIALAVMLASLPGCSGGSPDLEGKWRLGDDPSVGVDVKLHEGQYRVTLVNMLISGMSIRATYADGALQLADPLAGCSTIFYDTQSDQLDICGHATLMRAD